MNYGACSNCGPERTRKNRIQLPYASPSDSFESLVWSKNIYWRIVLVVACNKYFLNFPSCTDSLRFNLMFVFNIEKIIKPMIGKKNEWTSDNRNEFFRRTKGDLFIKCDLVELIFISQEEISFHFIMPTKINVKLVTSKKLVIRRNPRIELNFCSGGTCRDHRI